MKLFIITSQSYSTCGREPDPYLTPLVAFSGRGWAVEYHFVPMAEDGGSAAKAVGPYLLQRTLGKGQTGKDV